MFRQLTTLTTCVLALAAATLPVHAQGVTGQAGVAAAVRGDVTLVATTVSQPGHVVGTALGSGDSIFLGDNIETGPDSGMQIMLLDETIFTIGPSAGMVIDEFVYDPSTSTGQVTASVVKGAFRFVSGRVAKETPQNMSVRTPVGTIGIRGTSAAGRIDPPDASGNARGTIILLGPGANNNANERAGRILVTNGGTTVEITRSGFGTTIIGLNGTPAPPVRFTPAQVAGLTGGLGTSGGTAGTQPGSGGGTGGGGPIGSGTVTGLSGQRIGEGGGIAGFTNDAGTLSDDAGDAAEEIANADNGVNTVIATFDQLRAIQTGTAFFNFGTVALNYVSGTNTDASGSFNASAIINFGTRELDLTVSDIQYNFGGSEEGSEGFDEGFDEGFGEGGEGGSPGVIGNGSTEMFVFSPNAGGGQPFDGGYENQNGFVAQSWSSDSDSANFPTAPTDGSTAVITAAILNDIESGTAAAQALVSMTISDANSDTVIAGAGVANRQ